MIACQDCRWCVEDNGYYAAVVYRCHHSQSAESVPNFLAGTTETRYPDVQAARLRGPCTFGGVLFEAKA